jgi:hypothetical protein
MSRLNAFFCDPIVWCAWVSSDLPAQWQEVHDENKSLLNDAIEIIHDATVTLASCQDGSNLGPFPSPERTGEVLTLIECAKALDYFRDLSVAELLTRLDLWLNKLASGVGLPKDESVLIQAFFGYLARMMAARGTTPMCGVAARKARPYGH